jgi:hypothetical protein
MNRELLVTLIRKNIDELTMLTEGFMEMKSYPAAIINLAKNKTDDIWSYINQLETLKPEEKDEQKETASFIETTREVSEAKEVAFNTAEEIKEEEKDIVDKYPEEAEEIEEEEQEEDVDEDEQEEEEEEEEEEDEEIEDESLIDVVEVVDVVENQKNTETVEESITVELTEIVDKETIDQEETVNTVTTTETIEKKITIAEKISGNGKSRNEMHARTENNGINATIANKKIDDIRHAISLGDRFRFQRELFKNNGEEMNKTLSYINKLATYDEVVNFLRSKYGWEDGNDTAEDFYQIIKRKF